MGVRDSAYVNHNAADLIQAVCTLSCSAASISLMLFLQMMEPEPDRRIPIGRMKNHRFFADLYVASSVVVAVMLTRFQRLGPSSISVL